MTKTSVITNNRYFKYGFMLTMAIFLLFGTHTHILSAIPFFMILFSIFKFEDSFTIQIMVFIMPLANIFNPGPNSTSYYTYLIIVYVIRKFFLKGKIQGSIVIFAIYLILSQFFSMNTDIKQTVKMISNFMLLEYFIEDTESDKYTGIFISYVLGVIIASQIGNMSNNFFRVSDYINYKSLNMGDNYDIDVNRFSGLYTDPNYYSVDVILAMSIVAILYMKDDLKAYQMMIFMGICLYFITLTFSKSALLMCSIPVYMILYINRKKNNKKVQILLIGIMIIAVIWLIVGNSNYLNVMITRISVGKENGLSGLTTHRSDLWMNYLIYIYEHPLAMIFGRSITAPLLGGVGVHDVYIETLYNLGIFGGILMVLVIMNLFFSKCFSFQRTIINKAPIIICVIMYVFLCAIFSYCMPIHLFLCYLAYNQKFVKIRRTISDQYNFDNI